MNKFKFLNNIYEVCYPSNYTNKPDHVKYAYSTGWNMFIEGCYFDSCPFVEHRFKVIWKEGYIAARNKKLNGTI